MYLHRLFNPQARAYGPATDYQPMVENYQWVVSIGNMDGVHRGHTGLVAELIQRAHAHDVGRAGVMIFEPQPLEYFYGDKAPLRLTSTREKVELLFALGLDCVLISRFDARLAATTPLEFVSGLCNALSVHELVLGEDFRFGRERAGDLEIMSQLGKSHGFNVARFSEVQANQMRISSSRIRELIARHDFKGAQDCLGRPFLLAGRVKYGRQLGRQLGFPTANIHLERRGQTLNGVFVGWAHIPYTGLLAFDASAGTEQGISTKRYMAVANCGSRPTVDDENQWQVEVHIIDPRYKDQQIKDQQIYGERLAFEPLKLIRTEQKFAHTELLRKAIAQDLVQAHQFFASIIAEQGD